MAYNDRFSLAWGVMNILPKWVHELVSEEAYQAWFHIDSMADVVTDSELHYGNNGQGNGMAHGQCKMMLTWLTFEMKMMELPLTSKA